jgi:hypothetical protein
MCMAAYGCANALAKAISHSLGSHLPWPGAAGPAQPQRSDGTQVHARVTRPPALTFDCLKLADFASTPTNNINESGNNDRRGGTGGQLRPTRPATPTPPPARPPPGGVRSARSPRRGGPGRLRAPNLHRPAVVGEARAGRATSESGLTCGVCMLIAVRGGVAGSTGSGCWGSPTGGAGPDAATLQTTGSAAGAVSRGFPGSVGFAGCAADRGGLAARGPGWEPREGVWWGGAGLFAGGACGGTGAVATEPSGGGGTPPPAGRVSSCPPRTARR